MESYKMRMSQGGGLPPLAAALLPPLPPSSGRPTASGEKLQMLRPYWTTNQMNLNLHGNGKNIAPEGEELAAPPLLPSEDQIKQLPLGESDKDLNAEAKRLRRVMQSRQYSQKYRLKQLHYISQLESELKALQAEVTITSPRIKFMDRQNSLLRAENYSIKEKLSAYTSELLFKEAQYEELKRERNMLKEIYEAYQLKLLETLKNNTTARSTYQLVAIGQHGDLNQKPIDPAALQHKSNPFSMLEN